MYKRGVILWIIVVALLTGCVGKSNKHASDVTPTVGGVTSAADVKTTQTIFWQLAIIGGPSLEEAEEINRLLREKGYDFEIQFVRTGAYVPEMNRSWLEDYENNNQPFDILNGGIWNDIYDWQSFLLDYFEPITDYLISLEEIAGKQQGLLKWAQSLTDDQVNYLCDGGWYNDAMKGYIIASGKNAGFDREQIQALLNDLRLALSDLNRKDAERKYTEF